MGSGIFLRDGDSLTEMQSTTVLLEDELQQLLAQFPELLGLRPNEPVRLVLVEREAGLPSSPDGAARWSIDHLFLDQDGVPTIVEVKRGDNTQIRREVVGQMLDYAANAIAFWPVETIRAKFEAKFVGELKPEIELRERLGIDNVDDFWTHVRDNLATGKLRLLFVADSIPDELKRIVEFLNNQMSRTEVLAVEIKQYQHGGKVAIMPRVFGESSMSSQAKGNVSRSRATPWTWDEFREVLQTNKGLEAVKSAKRLLDRAHEANLRVVWGRGPTFGSFIGKSPTGRGLFYAYTDGSLMSNQNDAEMVQIFVEVFGKKNTRLVELDEPKLTTFIETVLAVP